MNPDIQHYLKRATRGLWGRKRLEVKEELSAHIEARITAHRIAGLSEEDAVDKTFQELGHPREVSNEMMRLHTLPTALGLGTLLAAACAVTVILVSSTLAQPLNVTQTFPSEDCLKGNAAYTQEIIGDLCSFYEGNLWTSVDALKEVLEPQGVEVRSGIGTLQLKFPDANPVGFSFYQRPFVGRNGEFLNEVSQLKPNYLPLWDVVGHIAELSGKTLQFEGWDNPVLRLEGTTLQLGTSDETVPGTNFYTYYVASIMDELVPSSAIISTYTIASPQNTFGMDFHPQRFDIGGEPGDIYGIISITDPYTGDLSDVPAEERRATDAGFILDVALVDRDGIVTLNLPSESVVPAQDIQFLSTFGNQPQVGEAVLVRLTGQADKDGFGYEVVPSEQIRLESP